MTAQPFTTVPSGRRNAKLDIEVCRHRLADGAGVGSGSAKRPEAIAVPRIVTAKKTKPAAATTDGGEAVTERKPAQAAAIPGLRIVTARKPCLQTP